MTLYEQLMYNWERGFYSVIEDSDHYYRIAHHKCGKDDFIFVTNCFEKVKIAIHYFFVGALYNQDDLKEYGSNWKIVDTIHPSELMGKGFQVGDKVLLHGKVYDIIRMCWPTAFLRDANNEHAHLINEDCRRLKPVLPVEEKVDMNGKKDKKPVSLEDKLVTSTLNVEFDSGTPQVTLGYEISQRSHICNCGFWNSEKVWGETLYTQQFGDSCKSMSITNNYVVCSKCGERLRRVKVTYLDDIGKDGHIANL